MAEKKQQAATAITLIIALIPLVQKNIFDRIWPPHEAAVKSVRETVLTMYDDLLQPKIDAIADKVDDTNKRVYRVENVLIEGPPVPVSALVKAEPAPVVIVTTAAEENESDKLNIDESKLDKRPEPIIKRKKDDWKTPLPNVEVLQQQMAY